VETQNITDSVRKDLVKPNFVVETQTITDSGSYTVSGRLRCIKDTYVDQYYPNSNYGSSITVDYDNSTDVGQGYKDAYLQFSPFPSGVTLTKAILWFFHAGGLPNAYAIRAITSPWNEYTVTWNTRPSYGSTTLYSGSFPSTVAWFSINIIDHFWDFNNYGLVFYSPDVPASYGCNYIYSREYAGYEPYIEIEYQGTI